MLPEGPAGPPGPEDVWQGLCLGAQTTGAEGVGSSSDSDLGCVTLGKLRNLPAPPRLHSSHCRVEGAAGELFHPITGSLRSLTAQAHLCLEFWGPRLKVRLLYHEPALLQSSLPYPVALQVVSGAHSSREQALYRRSRTGTRSFLSSAPAWTHCPHPLFSVALLGPPTL